MTIGFFVNNIQTDEPGHTTSRLDCAAANQGRDVLALIVGDLAFNPNGFAKVIFNKHVVEAHERKIRYMKFYGLNFDDSEMCTL